MELIRSNLYVYYDQPPHNGKWITASAVLNSDGNLEVKVRDEDKKAYIISNNCVIQAPMDTVWNRIPPLPFRRSAKETFSLNSKKGPTTWFLASSEEQRNQWYAALTPFVNRNPPPYGDYDNWTYSDSASEPETKFPKQFHPRKSLTPQHRSGFYTVQLPTRKSLKFPTSLDPEHQSGPYSTYDPKKSSRSIIPQQRSGFYSVHEPKRKISDEPIVSQIRPADVHELKPEPPNDNSCHCCYDIGSGVCNVLGTCFQQCCLNFAAAIRSLLSLEN